MSDVSNEDNCTICFEPWTTSNEHRLVSLKCGHLFGRSCITRWLEGQNPRCPQCNTTAQLSEIRNIYAKCVKVIDSSKSDETVADLLKANEIAKKSAANEKFQKVLLLYENERLKKELMVAQKQLQEIRLDAKAVTNSSTTNSVLSPFHLQQIIPIAKDGGCKVVDFSELHGMLIISQPAPTPSFNSGYGFRKISTQMDMRYLEFVLVHQEPLTDMAFHPDNLVLTAALDKTLKISSLITNSVIQTYNFEADVSSCTWDAEDSNYFYCGLRNGELYAFDMRLTRSYLQRLPDVGSRTPVLSLHHFYNSTSSLYAMKSRLIVGKMSECALYEKAEIRGQYHVYPFPIMGPIIYVSSKASGHVLVSTAPSSLRFRVTHSVFKYASEAGQVICSPKIQTTGGSTQEWLNRSKLLNHPDIDSSLLICSGDEDAHGALIWDASSGKDIDYLRTDSPVLDLVDFKVNHTSFLSALTDKSFYTYRWKS